MKIIKFFVFTLFFLLSFVLVSHSATIPPIIDIDFLEAVKKLTAFVRPVTILTFVGVVIWGGYTIETAGTKSENITKGIQIIGAGILGLVVMFLAPSLPDFIAMIFGSGTFIDF